MIVLNLTGCGGGGYQHNPTHTSFSYSSEIELWQSYSASPQGGMHYWNNESQEYLVNKLDRINDRFGSGYGFVDVDRALIFANLATGEKFKLEKDSYSPLSSGKFNNFESADRYFYSQGNLILGCRKDSETDCLGIEIMAGTFPYVYAKKDSNVLVITNWGDAVKFDGVGWCRMSRNINDIFSCDDQEPMVQTPRRIQFYSSIKYQGEILIGEWPTGSIYTFDGKTISPSTKWTPPTMYSRERIGYEAQSMAEYCGDLFVGYWPKGELWKFSRDKNQWEFFKRFFSDRGDDTFIPWVNRPPDGQDSAFFGQRVTALIPFEKSLYAVTSNLRSWGGGVFPEHLQPNEIDEYGSIYEIRGKDCLTVY